MTIVAAPDRWQVAGCLAAVALAVAVAAVIKREAADFSALPPLAVVRDQQRHKLWAIRVAAAAHLIAVDAVDAPPPPDGHAYQLWLSGPKDARSLGLLPAAGRKIIPEMPAVIAGLDAGRGELTVTLEPARGSLTGQPSGPVMFRSPLAARCSPSSPAGEQQRLRDHCFRVRLRAVNAGLAPVHVLSRPDPAPAPSLARGG